MILEHVAFVGSADTSGLNSAGCDEVPTDPTAPSDAIQADIPDAQLLFSNTAVGGTFDRLHAGHRILLAATALVTTSMAFIGVTSIPLLHHLSATTVKTALLYAQHGFSNIFLLLKISASKCILQKVCCIHVL